MATVARLTPEELTVTPTPSDSSVSAGEAVERLYANNTALADLTEKFLPLLTNREFLSASENIRQRTALVSDSLALLEGIFVLRQSGDVIDSSKTANAEITPDMPVIDLNLLAIHQQGLVNQMGILAEGQRVLSSALLTQAEADL